MTYPVTVNTHGAPDSVVFVARYILRESNNVLTVAVERGHALAALTGSRTYFSAVALITAWQADTLSRAALNRVLHTTTTN